MDGCRKGGGGGLGCSSSRHFATFHPLCHPLEAMSLLWAHTALCLQTNPAPCTGLGSARRGPQEGEDTAASGPDLGSPWPESVP